MVESKLTQEDAFEYDEILIFAVGATKYDAVMKLKTLKVEGGKKLIQLTFAV